MESNDYNIIKPAEPVQNIGALTPANRREERKKQRNLNEKKEKKHESIKDELNEAIEENSDDQVNENEQDNHSIDYCA